MKLRGLIAFCLSALAAFSPAVYAAEAVAADSLSTALAVFVGNVVDGTVRNFENRGLTVDRIALGACLADVLAGRPVEMTPEQADAYLSRRFDAAARVAMPVADAAAEAAFLASAAAEKGRLGSHCSERGKRICSGSRRRGAFALSGNILRRYGFRCHRS